MVIWADPAKSDLRAIHDFIASDSKYYAKKVVQDIVDRTNILEEYPRIGRKAPEIDDENIREISRIHTGFSTRSNRRKYMSSGSFTADGILHQPMSTESKNPNRSTSPQNAKFKDLTPLTRGRNGRQRDQRGSLLG
jgi:plasmid stabilization system protein ParE